MRPTVRAAWLLAFAIGVIAVLTLLASLQRQLLYFPLAEAPPPVAGVLPGAEDVTFETADGLRLFGWFRQGPPGSTTVVVMNGNAGDRSHRAPLAAALAREGFGVLLFDYRGYAGNPGTPSERGLLADARAAVDHVASRSDVDPARIAYYGESLGAAVAVALSAERPPAALILRSPFTSLEDIAKLHYPWLPVGALLVERYPVVDLVPNVRAPLLVIAGTADRIVPLRYSQRVYDAAAQPKRFLAIEGADHNDLAMLAGPQLVAAVAALLRQGEVPPDRAAGSEP